MNRAKTSALMVLLVTAGWARGYCQSSAPQDPKALMALAHEKNGLVGPDVKPWHIRAIYSAFDLDGHFDYQGTYEEWWIDATHYRVRFTNPQFTQTDYATGAGLYRDGSQAWIGGRELRLETSLLDPLPEAAVLGDFAVSYLPAAGTGRAVCVLMRYATRSKARLPDGDYPTACFEPSDPILRFYRNQGAEQINYDDTVLFRGHYVARQIQYLSGGVLLGEMKVEVIEPLSETAPEVLAVPPSARAVDLAHIRFTAVEGTGFGGGLMLLKKVLPRAPLLGSDSHSNGGLVDLEADAGTDGHVTDVKLLSAKNMMSESAMAAVREWSFAPFEVMGQPRPFVAEIKLLFAMR